MAAATSAFPQYAKISNRSPGAPPEPDGDALRREVALAGYVCLLAVAAKAEPSLRARRLQIAILATYTYPEQLRA